jgi:hypothetical protein
MMKAFVATGRGDFFVLEGTPAKNDKIEVKKVTIPPRFGGINYRKYVAGLAHDLAQGVIDVYVFYAGDGEGFREVICCEPTLEVAARVFFRSCVGTGYLQVVTHDFVLRHPKVQLQADVCKAKLDLNTRKVLDAEPCTCKLLERLRKDSGASYMELTCDLPPNFAAKKRGELIGSLQEYLDCPARQIVFETFKDPRAQSALLEHRLVVIASIPPVFAARSAD